MLTSVEVEFFAQTPLLFDVNIEITSMHSFVLDICTSMYLNTNTNNEFKLFVYTSY